MAERLRCLFGWTGYLGLRLFFEILTAIEGGSNVGAKSNIEWTDASWTPIRARPKPGEKLINEPGWKSARPGGKPGWYCEHVSDGCRNCYAESMNYRLGTGIDFARQNRHRVEIFLDEKMLSLPIRWQKSRMVFVCSMTDLFAEFVKDEWINEIFAIMARCPQHTFQVLTKRAERMLRYSRDNRHPESWPLSNVWLGISCERQQEAEERIPLLLQTPAAVRFISAEPLLGPIDLRGLYHNETMTDALDGISETPVFPRGNGFVAIDPTYSNHRKLDWVIVGGESGREARPMNPQWVCDLRDQCEDTATPFFFKQWGEWISSNSIFGEFERVGKKAAGRLLNGVEYNGLPPSMAVKPFQQNRQPR